MSVPFKSRLTKLESRVRAKGAQYPKIVFGENNRQEFEIVAISSNGHVLARNGDESLEQLIARGGREFHENILFFEYAGGKAGDPVVLFPATAIAPSIA